MVDGTPVETAPTTSKVMDWLLELEQPSVRYFTLTELLGRPEEDPLVRRARTQMTRVGWAADLLSRQRPEGFWEARAPTTLNSWFNFLYWPQFTASFYRAIVLGDLGLTNREPRIVRLAEQFFGYKLRLSSGANWFTEEACVVGHAARMLTRFGYAEEFRVRKLFDRLVEDQREDGGWHCQAGGPGTLDAWEPLAAFASLPKRHRSAAIQRAVERGAEFYLKRRLFREGRRYAPWFRFHYPTHYFYDILVGLDVITQLGYAGDGRLRPALEVLGKKRRADGTWALDRVHPDLGPGVEVGGDPEKVRPWALESPGRPSKWITLTALRVLRRVEDAG
jgi:hypothetical protein